MELNISPLADQKINESILITGAARSGTTIVGKLIHSFSNIEYTFEPPMLFSLFSLIHNISEQDWKLLFETYLYEDFFLNAIAGRSINCNRSDDSSIYNVKGGKEVEERLSKSKGKIEAEEVGHKKTIAYKMPDVVPFLSLLQKYYPGLKVVIVKRDALGTINSLLNKRWFAKDNQGKNLIWPFKMINGQKIPFWVQEEDSTRWIEMSEIDRCAYYYVCMNRNINTIFNLIEVKYEDLIANPDKVCSQLADTLDLRYGAKTKDILNTIKPTIKQRDDKILDSISSDLFSQISCFCVR